MVLLVKKLTVCGTVMRLAGDLKSSVINYNSSMDPPTRCGLETCLAFWKKSVYQTMMKWPRPPDRARLRLQRSRNMLDVFTDYQT